MQPRHVVPADVLHEGVDVLRGGGAVVFGSQDSGLMLYLMPFPLTRQDHDRRGHRRSVDAAVESHELPAARPRIVRSSNAVIESAFVHNPTRPDLKRESR